MYIVLATKPNLKRMPLRKAADNWPSSTHRESMAKQSSRGHPTLSISIRIHRSAGSGLATGRAVGVLTRRADVSSLSSESTGIGAKADIRVINGRGGTGRSLELLPVEEPRTRLVDLPFQLYQCETFWSLLLVVRPWNNDREEESENTVTAMQDSTSPQKTCQI